MMQQNAIPAISHHTDGRRPMRDPCMPALVNAIAPNDAQTPIAAATTALTVSTTLRLVRCLMAKA